MTKAEQLLTDMGMLAKGDTTMTSELPQTTENYDELDSITMGAPPAAKFAEPGALVQGRIVRAFPQQVRDIDTQELAYWDDGRPKMQAVVILDQGTGTDSLITLYVGSSGLREAIKTATREAGIGLRPGGQLAVRYVRDGEPFKKGLNPPKIYEAAYDPPASLARKIVQDKALVAENIRTQALAQSDEPPF